MRFIDRFLHKFGYDAATTSKRRKAASPVMKSEDNELSVSKRKQLIANARDLQRNYAVAAWAIRTHLRYTTSYTFQAKTGNDSLNKRIEELVEWYSRPHNCDVAARFSLQRMIRTLEGRSVLDGDCFLMKVSDGRLQAIEGDRICNGSGANVAKDLVHGVKLSKAGKALSYCVAERRKTGGGYENGRMVPSRNMLPLAYYDRFDQCRGISPLAAAVNSFRDLYEGTDLALAKAKVAQLFALAIHRESYEPLGTITSDEDEDNPKYDIDFGKGPILLDLEPGDTAEFLESKSPSAEFQTFSRTVIMIALKSLNIPMVLFDEANANYTSSRMALLQYQESVQDRRQAVLAVLNVIIRWRLGLFVEKGVLELPAGFKIPDLKFEFVPLAIPSMDPLREVKASAQELDLKITSRQRLCKERGIDFEDVLAELKREEELLAEAGISTGAPGVGANIQ